jgi:hypothetical protein
MGGGGACQPGVGCVGVIAHRMGSGAGGVFVCVCVGGGEGGSHSWVHRVSLPARRRTVSKEGARCRDGAWVVGLSGQGTVPSWSPCPWRWEGGRDGVCVCVGWGGGGGWTAKARGGKRVCVCVCVGGGLGWTMPKPGEGNVCVCVVGGGGGVGVDYAKARGGKRVCVCVCGGGGWGGLCQSQGRETCVCVCVWGGGGGLGGLCQSQGRETCVCVGGGGLMTLTPHHHALPGRYLLAGLKQVRVAPRVHQRAVEAQYGLRQGYTHVNLEAVRPASRGPRQPAGRGSGQG